MQHETNRAELQDKLRSKLQGLGIGYNQIKVFGQLRLNIHVTCEKEADLDQWVVVLTSMADGCDGTVKVIETDEPTPERPKYLLTFIGNI